MLTLTATLLMMFAGQHHAPTGAAMGFDQDKTVHHFVLRKDGGAVQVSVKDAKDTQNRDHIRMHLQMIAKQFGEGVFDSPLETHGEEPAGVATMRQMKSRIRYTFHETAGGGEVAIQTRDAAALAAVHDFLRYQIQEHKTGDPTAVPK
jgi:hypothetical protein